MCQFFSCIVTRQGQVLFTEHGSHEVIIERAHLRDTDLHLRHWIRVELRPQGDGWAPILVDEAETPAWWTEDAPVLTDRVTQIADRVRAARPAYDAIEQPAWATYDSAKLSAQAAYVAIERPAWAASKAAERSARDAAAKISARAAYEAAKLSARAAYDAIEQPARAAYDAAKQPALATYAAALARIPGYCAANLHGSRAVLAELLVRQRPR